MIKAQPGILDPISGGYFWCLPVREGHLDLSALGI